MSKGQARLGKTVSIFNRTATAEATIVQEEIQSTRPSVENKLTVIFPPDIVEYLDQLSISIRAKTKAKIRRTELVRAFIAGVRATGIDLTTYRSEADIAEAIKRGLMKA